jgi:DNA integrity scanning protein DisA with diadenylate cyclase activity
LLVTRKEAGTYYDVRVLLCWQNELSKARFDGALILLKDMQNISFPLNHVSPDPVSQKSLLHRSCRTAMACIGCRHKARVNQALLPAR